jgi:hypothetical protein
MIIGIHGPVAGQEPIKGGIKLNNVEYHFNKA